MTSQQRDGRSVRWDAHREHRRQAIIEAAIAVIESDGPDAATGRITEQAGVPRTHLYRHFPDKQALDRAVARHALEELATEIRVGLATQGSILDVVRSAINHHVRWLEAHPNLHRFLEQHSLGAEVSTDAKAAFSRELTALLEGYLTRWGVSTRPAAPLIAGLVGMVDFTVTWWLDQDDLSRDELTELLVQQTWVILAQAAAELGLTLAPEDSLPELEG